jgi:16S rRNA (guanine527-N7)-methyltransferase
MYAPFPFKAKYLNYLSTVFMAIIPDDLIDRTLGEYRVSATPTIRSNIRTYISLLLKWNESMALTTITDPIAILRSHFGESMFAASVVPIWNGRLADVGSGAGFPGLPLKIMVPSLQLVLIESNAKKVSFLAECVRELKLVGVDVLRSRFEDLDESGSEFDFITARALGGYERLIRWTQRSLASGGALILWLGQKDATELRKEPTLEWQSSIRIPNSDRRVLLVGGR